jgi:DNA-binding CsgD family transcriptional regulator
MAVKPEDVRSDLARMVGRPLEAAEFGHLMSAAVRRLLPYDGWCLVGLDPHTGLRTFQLGQHGIEQRTAELARNESLMPDVNKYTDLAHSPSPAAWLSTDHPLAPSSYRLNELMRPQGFHSEIRLVLCERERTWGALVLFRDSAARLFDESDARTAAAICAPLTRAVRRFPVRHLAIRPEPIGPGVVLLAADDRLLSLSPQAQQWLDDLVPGGEDETGPADVRRVVFDAANAARRKVTASMTIRTVGGRWLSIEGVPLSAGEADVAVLLQPATPRHLLPAFSAYHGLTRRESQILDGIAEGQPAKHIARALDITVLTVNAHLTSIYRRCGVSGREELMARTL